MGYVKFGVDHSQLPDSVSPEKVRAEAREISERIFGDRELLKKIIDRHEATIHKRWFKKTKTQRTKILLEAWPGMATSHRPDFAAWRHASVSEPKSGENFKEAFLWPCVNLEDLTKPKSLLIFLRSRAENDPNVFAFTDWYSAHFGYAVGRVAFGCLHRHTMMFNGRVDASLYGELVCWDDDSEAEQWLLSGRGMYPGHGLVMLKTQQRILRFLVDCAQSILHDKLKEDLASESDPLEKSPTLEIGTIDGFATRAVVAAEAPYHPPAGLDLALLEALLAARVQAAEDHIHSLREDPSYFVDALRDCNEHLPHMIPWGGRGKDPLHRTQDTIWRLVIESVVGEAYSDLGTCIEVHAQVKEVQALKVRHEHDISIEKDLPAEYLYALHKLLYAVNTLMRVQLELLTTGMTSSPPLRTRFVRVQAPQGQGESAVYENFTDASEGQAQLMWLLREMRGDGELIRHCGLIPLVDELERLLSTDKEAKELVSAHTAHVLADLAIFAECLYQLETCYQPWASTFGQSITVADRDSIKRNFSDRMTDLSLFHDRDGGSSLEGVAWLGDPRDGRFHYPANKRRTKDNVEHMRRAEANLDDFWAATDLTIKDVRGDKLHDATLSRMMFSKSATLQRTSAWEEVKHGKKQSSERQAPKMSMSEMVSELQHLTEQTIDRAPASTSKTKMKTRDWENAPTGDHVEWPVADPQPQAAENEVVFAVDARALKVFRTLFYTPTSDAEPGAVAWKDFLHAMVSLGFAPEKLYGTVWQFAPDTLDVERSIQFHEPHPEDKVPYLHARRNGRRLSRAYRWTGDMFELRTKVSV